MGPQNPIGGNGNANEPAEGMPDSSGVSPAPAGPSPVPPSPSPSPSPGYTQPVPYAPQPAEPGRAAPLPPPPPPPSQWGTGTSGAYTGGPVPPGLPGQPAVQPVQNPPPSALGGQPQYPGADWQAPAPAPAPGGYPQQSYPAQPYPQAAQEPYPQQAYPPGQYYAQPQYEQSQYVQPQYVPSPYQQPEYQQPQYGQPQYPQYPYPYTQPQYPPAQYPPYGAQAVTVRRGMPAWLWGLIGAAVVLLIAGVALFLFVLKPGAQAGTTGQATPTVQAATPTAVAGVGGQTPVSTPSAVGGGGDQTPVSTPTAVAGVGDQTPFPATPTPTPGSSGGNANARATISNTTYDNNFTDTQSGKKGVQFVINWQAQGLKGNKVTVATYLYDSSGQPLKQNATSQYQLGGRTATWNTFDDTYDDGGLTTKIFIPYDEIQVPTGAQALKYSVGIYISGAQNFLARSDLADLPVIAGGSQPGGPKITVSDISADVDVVVSGTKGLRIRTSFVADNLKGSQVGVIAYFYDSNGQPLKPPPGSQYQFNNQVAVWDTSTPNGYDSTKYTDFQVFIPYDKIPLPSGPQHLKFGIQIYKLNGDTYYRSDLRDVSYTQP